MRKTLDRIIFEARWILYPVNLGLLVVLLLYVYAFLVDDWNFVWHEYEPHNIESLMVLMLGFVDASMVANLIIMIVQGSHQIFIHKFEPRDKSTIPQYLDHIDTGILKVKVALSIASITLIQILKDFVNIEQVNWTNAVHRMMIHGMALLSALLMALIWRITHPGKEKDHVSETH